MPSSRLRHMPGAVAALAVLSGCAVSPGGCSGSSYGSGDAAAYQAVAGGYQAITGQSEIARRSLEAVIGSNAPPGAGSSAQRAEPGYGSAGGCRAPTAHGENARQPLDAAEGSGAPLRP